MAAVLDALAPYVKQMITNMAEEQVHVLLGVSDEIMKLQNTMERLKAFHVDAERRRIKEEGVKIWVLKLKNAMYDGTDILDLCRLEADRRKESNQGGSLEEKMPGCFQPLLFCLRNPVFAHKIGRRIKELNQRLEDIHKEAMQFSFINLGSYQERRMPEQPSISSGYRTMSEFDESAIVGMKIEMDTKELIHVLTDHDDNHNLKVVSIEGMGGMGKTTLAQKIFKETKHFKTKIWLSINQVFDQAELMRSVIKQAGSTDHGNEQDLSLLARSLIDALSMSKFLLVMDDMWSDEAWNNEQAPLRVPVINASLEQPGSRVLVTTRFGDLAPKMRASFHRHPVSPLGKEDAWSLLKKQLPPNQVIGIDQLKDVGLGILEKCNGLPLAVKVVGGLLSTKRPTEREWKQVLNNPAWSVDGLPRDLDNRVYLSYEDLSPQLKQCFLYCSLIPKGKDIHHLVVISMWIGEGFIHESHHSGSCDDDRLEEVATEYYKELIKRNLIEPAVRYSVTGYRCTMHDVVRSFAEFMAREESLVVVEDRQAAAVAATSTGTIRRLCVGQTTTIPVEEWAIFLQKLKSLRTLMIFSSTNIRLANLVASCSYLRVLQLEQVECGSLVHLLCQLKHLRCLHLRATDISRLPDDIHKMKSLEHISVVRCKKLCQLPSNIVKLQQLRFLNLTGSNVIAVPKGFGALKNLRTLKGFTVHMDNMDCTNGGQCSLQEIGPLSRLRDLELYGLENTPAGSWAEKAAISSKEHLGYLKLHCSYNRYMGSTDEIEKKQQQQGVEEVFQELRPPSCIEDLTIKGYFGRRLPNWMMVEATTAFKSLRILRLVNLPCCTQLPDGLCRLCSLEGLEIVDAPAVKSVGPEFQVSSSLAVAFPNLRTLHLEGLREWEEWEWEEDATNADATTMPALKAITIKNCKLSRLPRGLASSKRHDLRELNLYELTNLTYVDNFPSIIELDVFDCPELKRISGISRVQKIRIVRCPNLKTLEDVPALDILGLDDDTMETLPEYLRGVNPRHLELYWPRKLSTSISPDGSDWDKIKHIGKHSIIYKD